MNFFQQAAHKFKHASVVEKLIAVNVALFILSFGFKTIAFLFQFPESNILGWFVFSQDLGSLLYKPWSIITYAFFHGDFFHIFFNMLVLYYAGTLFLTYFSPKRLLNFYFLGAISGALVYALSYNLFPVFAGSKSYLIGASAAVMAVLVGIATHIPYLGIRLLFLGTVKLWHIAVFFVVLDLIRIPMGNAGGHLAHLGGALLGYVYVKQLDKGKDIGKWWEQLMDWFTGLFTGRKKQPFKTVHRNRTTAKKQPKSTAYSKDDKQQKIDAILDKISKSGYDSLSKQEKDFLFKAGKDS